MVILVAWDGVLGWMFLGKSEWTKGILKISTTNDGLIQTPLWFAQIFARASRKFAQRSSQKAHWKMNGCKKHESMWVWITIYLLSLKPIFLLEKVDSSCLQNGVSFLVIKKITKGYFKNVPSPPNKREKNRFTSYAHHPKTNIAPENWCLKD